MTPDKTQPSEVSGMTRAELLELLESMRRRPEFCELFERERRELLELFERMRR